MLAINVAVTSDNTSSGPRFPEMISLTRNVPELGESEGARRRIDMLCGTTEQESANRWGSGCKILGEEGIERDRVGDRFVGGSILIEIYNT